MQPKLNPFKHRRNSGIKDRLNLVRYCRVDTFYTLSDGGIILNSDLEVENYAN